MISRVGESAFLLLQHILPRFLLTSVIHRLARIRLRPVKDILIRLFVRFYKVDVAEVQQSVPDDYPSFNDFFTRALADGQRPMPDDPLALASPADGTISALGVIDGQSVLQAKGINYGLAELLATNLDDLKAFSDGSFLTVYLAPYNYHRVHSPLDGELVAARYVPGDLYSVNKATVSRLPGLFTRNERLICHFSTRCGPMVLIFVGAMNVGSISTEWTGEIRPRNSGVVSDLNLGQSNRERTVTRGQLLGWFNMGSTVIVLTPPGAVQWAPELTAGSTLRMGQGIGQTQRTTS